MKSDLKTLVANYVLLMILLTSTVLASLFNLGAFALPVALTIAVLKTLAVVWFFMELRFSSTLIRLAAAVGILWLAFFYILAATDTLTRPLMNGSSWK